MCVCVCACACARVHMCARAYARECSRVARVKVNAEGMMLLQHRVRDKEDRHSYVSFYLLSESEDVDEDDDAAPPQPPVSAADGEGAA